MKPSSKKIPKKVSVRKKNTKKKTTRKKNSLSGKIFGSFSSITSSKNKEARFFAVLSSLLLGFLLAVIFGGLFIPGKIQTSKDILRVGNKVFAEVGSVDESLRVKLTNTDEFVVHQGKTWIPINSLPVKLFVVNDENCQYCDARSTINQLRSLSTPALIAKEISIDSPEGQKFRRQFDFKTLPAYIFDDSIRSVLLPDGVKFIDHFAQVLVEKNDHYLVDSESFPRGIFLKRPQLVTRGEPTHGPRGEILLVEFTDYQCPFCKRFYNQNKSLIDKLVKDGVIAYVIKDFPLNFNPLTMSMHSAANCALDLNGQTSYDAFRSAFFTDGSDLSNLTTENIREKLIRFSGTIGISEEKFTACLDSPKTKAEIQQDIEEGKSLGVSGTPAVFIDRHIMPGAIGPEVLQQVIDAIRK